MAYDAEQRAVIAKIKRIGAETGATPKEIKAALETGRVESQFHNLPGGDADSQGWRQERASLYKDPRNLDASIRRFYAETRAVRDKYARAGDLAAAVQRPAAQYRGRYQETEAEAQQLLGGGPSADGPPSSGSRKSYLLGKAGKVSAGSPPSWQPGSTTVDKKSALIDAMLNASQGGTLFKRAQANIASGNYTSTSPGRWVDGKAPAYSGGQSGTVSLPSGGGGAGIPTGELKPGGAYAGTAHLVNELAAIGHRNGLTTTSGKRATQMTTSGNVSDHFAGNKTADAQDLSNGSAPTSQMDRTAYQIARKLGNKGYKSGQPLVYSTIIGGYRYQVLYRTNVGGNHFNHVHVGVRKVA